MGDSSRIEHLPLVMTNMDLGHGGRTVSVL